MGGVRGAEHEPADGSFVVMRPRSPGSRLLAVGVLAALICGLSGGAAITPESSPRTTRSYVVTYFYGAISPNSEKEDCPDGFAKQPDPAQYYKDLTPAQLQAMQTGTFAVRVKFFERMSHRGPAGEDTCEHPTVDPGASMPVGRSKIGYGLHLDGGNASHAHCAHDEMTSPDGLQGVDNQIERLTACIRQRRQNGFLPSYELNKMREGQFTLLIQISGADNLRDADNVEVLLTSSPDPLVFSTDGKTPLEYASYTLGDNPRYHNVLKGRIRSGVLETVPNNVVVPSNEFRKEESFRDAQLRLVFKPDGTLAGLLGGYRDLDEFYRPVIWGGYYNEQYAGPYTCPGFYNALHALADGFPDPKTGRCTAISSATRIEAIPAFATPSARRTASSATNRPGAAARS